MVYGTAMAPEQRQPPGFVDSMSDLGNTMQGRDFEEIAAVLGRVGLPVV